MCCACWTWLIMRACRSRTGWCCWGGLLQASGELVALAGTAQIVTGDEKPAARGTTSPGPAGVTQRPVAGGLSLSLPYVPARLVIEMSGPAGETALLTYGGDAPAVTGGRLTLIPGRADTSSSGTEDTGA
jgi:hypothetical protein